MKNNNNIWLIVGISLLVAVVASVATLGLTGNIINVQSTVSCGKTLDCSKATDIITCSTSSGNLCTWSMDKCIVNPAGKGSCSALSESLCKSAQKVGCSWGSETANVYTQAEVDGNFGISSYMDPRRCSLKIVQQTDFTLPDLGVNCEGSNQFIGSITHIDCPDYGRDNRVITGTGWYDGTLPGSLYYTCVGSDGVWKSPSQIYAYCCKIASSGVPVPTATKTTTATTSVKKTARVDKMGVITVA